MGRRPEEIAPLLPSLWRWLADDNVVGFFVGPKRTGGADTGATAVVVDVKRKLAPSEIPGGGLRIPPTVELTFPDGKTEAVPTDVRQVGGAELLRSEEKERPLMGGDRVLSAGLGSTGTIGIVVPNSLAWSGPWGMGPVGLSCNHVLTMNANLGGKVYQPLEEDDENLVGVVQQYLPVRSYTAEEVGQEGFEPEMNEHDLAWMIPPRGAKVNDLWKPARVREREETAVTGIRAPRVGETVRVFGGVTRQELTAVVQAVDYVFDAGDTWPKRDGKTLHVWFKNLILLTPMVGVPGDSGAALIAQSDNKLVGILMARTTDHQHSLGCRIPT